MMMTCSCWKSIMSRPAHRSRQLWLSSLAGLSKCSSESPPQMSHSSWLCSPAKNDPNSALKGDIVKLNLFAQLIRSFSERTDRRLSPSTTRSQRKAIRNASLPRFSSTMLYFRPWMSAQMPLNMTTSVACFTFHRLFSLSLLIDNNVDGYVIGTDRREVKLRGGVRLVHSDICKVVKYEEHITQSRLP